MNKGEQTKQHILESGMDYVCQYGLSTISIGEVAKRLNMSRTGVISHFASKAHMQIAILRYCESIFIQHTLKPAYSLHPLTHLNNHLANWINWVFKYKGKQHMTCPFVKAIAEYQDRPECPVKSVIREQQQRAMDYLATIIQCCIDKKQLNKNSDKEDLVQQIFAFYLMHNVSKHLLNNSAADQTFSTQVACLIQANGGVIA